MIWNLDPVAFSLFGLDVRWYGLVYVAGFFLTVHLGHRLQQRLLSSPLDKEAFENFIFGVFVAGVIGGRLGQFVFYSPETLVNNVWEMFKIWHGGMSIHGGLIAGVGYAWWWARKHQQPLLALLDTITLPLAVTLIFGRIANFINGELVGRVTDQTWGIIFPHIDDLSRHPSQLYESGKNIILTIILSLLIAKGYGKRTGLLTTVFLAGYGALRFVIEFYREPEIMLGWLTTGQALCLAMIALAFAVAKKQHFWHTSP